MRMQKFHIYPNKESYDALYWDEQLIEFDTEAAAKDFIRCCNDCGSVGLEFFKDAEIRFDSVVNDDGYLNATFLRPRHECEGLFSIEGSN